MIIILILIPSGVLPVEGILPFPFAFLLVLLNLIVKQLSTHCAEHQLGPGGKIGIVVRISVGSPLLPDTMALQRLPYQEYYRKNETYRCSYEKCTYHDRQR